MTVDEARKLAKETLGRVANGADPLREKQRQRAEATVGEVTSLFLADRRRHKKPRTVAEYERLFEKEILPVFGTRALRTVTRVDVKAWHDRLGPRPAIANNVLAILGAMYRFAETEGLWAGVNPCARIARYELKSRKKSLSGEEYVALGAAFDRAIVAGLPVPDALRAQKRGMSKLRRAKTTGRLRGAYKRRDGRQPIPANPVSVAVLRFLALTGWREGEALSLRWDELDVARGVARLGDTKTGRSVRPLGKAALDLLEAQAREGDYVFPGAVAGAPLRDANRVWLAVKAAAGLTMRLHDLRHSFATVARELGYHDSVIAQLIGHTLEGMTSKYGDVPELTVRRAADAIAETVLRRLGGQPNWLPKSDLV